MDARQRAAARRNDPPSRTAGEAQQSRYAAQAGRTTPAAQPASYWPAHRSAEAVERRLQGKASQGEATAQEEPTTRHRGPQVVKAADGSGLAIQFDATRMRQVHIDAAGNVHPEGKWQPVNLPKLLNWVRHTSAAAPTSVAGFASLGASLAGGDE